MGLPSGFHTRLRRGTIPSMSSADLGTLLNRCFISPRARRASASTPSRWTPAMAERPRQPGRLAAGKTLHAAFGQRSAEPAGQSRLEKRPDPQHGQIHRSGGAPGAGQTPGTDLFLSLHYNSSPAGNNPVSGVEVFCLTPTGATPTNGGDQPSKASPGNRYEAHNVLLAYQIQKAIIQNLGLSDRGVRRAGFVVLRKAEMPAVLIEAGFMSDPAEARKIYDPAHRRRMAQAIVEGLLAYKRLVER